MSGEINNITLMRENKRYVLTVHNRVLGTEIMKSSLQKKIFRTTHTDVEKQQNKLQNIK
jgi:hypothetical protein